MQVAAAVGASAHKHTHPFMRARPLTPTSRRVALWQLRFECSLAAVFGVWRVADARVDSRAAGNTTVLKPSEIAEATAQQTAEMVPKYLDSEAAAVVLGGSRRQLPFWPRSGI